MPTYPSRTRFPVKLVSGYVYPVDTLPAQISFSKSPARIALVFNTYYPEVEGDFFLDYELILAALDPLFKMGKVKILDEQNSPVPFSELKNKWKHDRTDWFRQMEIQEQGMTLLQIFGQPWFRVGGPQPYHDSATVEIYMDRDRLEEIRQMVITELHELDITVELISGTRLPLRQRWWRGLFRG